MLTAQYNYYVDFNNDGDFSDANENISAYVLSSEWAYGSNSPEPGQTPAGFCRLKLDNSSSIFSSFNASSAIYGQILPGRRVKITMTIGAGSPVTMWAGYLETANAIVGEMVTVSTAELLAYGVLAQLSDADVDIAMQTDVTTGTAIGEVLDAAGFPAGDRDIDTGQSTLSRFWARGSSALEILRELEAAETGLLREGKDGKLAFEDRAHRLNSPHNAPQSTYGTGSLNLWNLSQEDPLQGVFNAVEANVRTFNKSEDITLAIVADVANRLGGEPPVIPGSGSKTIIIQFPGPDSSADQLAVDDWTIVDYEANTAPDGSGTDITSDISATRTELGNRLELVFTNANGSDAYLIVLRAHGVAIIEGSPIPVKDQDATSQTKYRKHAFPNPSQWITHLDEGEDYCAHIIALYKDPHPTLRFELKANYNAAHLVEAQTRDISDRIHITAASAFGLYIDDDFFVEAMAHRVDEGRLHTVQFYCRQAFTHSWPTSGTSYTPNVIPSDVGMHVPDDLKCYGYASGSKIATGCVAWKWNDGIYEADFRARRKGDLALSREADIVYAAINTESNYTIPSTGTISFWLWWDGSYGEIWDPPGDIPNISAGWLVCPAVGEPEAGGEPDNVFGVQAWGSEIRAGWKTAGSDKRVIGSSGLIQGQFNQVRLDWTNGGATRLFVGNVLVGSSSGLDATFDTSTYLLSVMTGLAPVIHGFGGALGRINWLGLWDEVLSDADGAALANKPPNEVDTDHLLDCWHLNFVGSETSTGSLTSVMQSNAYIGVDMGVSLTSVTNDYADLRTPEEGGDLVDDGQNAIIRTGLKANQWGANYSWLPDAPGDWFFAYRMRNLSGWSVWSDGNDVPKWVKDHIDGSEASNTDTGPPENWNIRVEAGPSPNTVLVKASRPAINGHTILFADFQIRDNRQGSWVDLDSGTEPSEVYYDGSVVAHTWDPDTFRFTRNTGAGFGDAPIESLLMVDVRGNGTFDRDHCIFLTITAFEGNDSTTATYLETRNAISHIIAGNNFRIKLVKPFWQWSIDGYLGSIPGMGVSNQEYWTVQNSDGSSGDKTTQEFVSRAIQIPTGVSATDVVARVWYFNSYSASDGGEYSQSGVIGGAYVLPILHDSPDAGGYVDTDASLGRDLFLVYVTEDFTLNFPTGLTQWGQPVIWIFVQTGSGGRITLGEKFRTSTFRYPVVLSTTIGARDYLATMYNQPDDELDVVDFAPKYT